MIQENFNRYEFKYIINLRKYKEVFMTLKSYITTDEFCGDSGFYKISSLYFDTTDDVFFHETLNEAPYRQKLRLRGYNSISLNDDVFFEIKKKNKGIVNKRRTKINLARAYDFFKKPNYDKSIISSSNQILREVDFLKKFYYLEPKVIVSYDRQAFQTIEDKDIRVTFDFNIRKNEYDLRLERGSQGTLVMDKDMVVMEVKANNRIPFWLTRILSELQCYRGSCSKYCLSHSNNNRVIATKEIV